MAVCRWVNYKRSDLLEVVDLAIFKGLCVLAHVCVCIAVHVQWAIGERFRWFIASTNEAAWLLSLIDLAMEWKWAWDYTYSTSTNEHDTKLNSLHASIERSLSAFLRSFSAFHRIS